jgi:hypothetical protein
VDLLGLCFAGGDRGSKLLKVDTRPDISRPEIAGAVLTYLDGSGPC